MVDEVIVHGDEQTVADRLAAAVECGATEILVSVLEPGKDRERSWHRTAALIAGLCTS
ncbi:MAG: hypothetical protein O3C69_05975 [Chloroflexi bacterium]|nr:hypothetical protein [Chloroflexota bacterium]